MRMNVCEQNHQFAICSNAKIKQILHAFFRNAYNQVFLDGFTLIELLIVVTILVTLLGVGLASFNSFNRRERLKQAALTLKSTLRFAQTKSISVEKPSSGCTSFVGMSVHFTAATYAVSHTCTPEGNVGSADTVTLSGITFSPIPADFTFVSRSNALSPSSTQTITLTNGTESYQLTVAPNGSVSDGGFQ